MRRTPHHRPQQFRSPRSAGHGGVIHLQFDEQGGTRISGAIGSKTSPAGAVVERDSDPPDLNPYQVVRVWTHRGDLVVYEYQNSRRATKLRYPVAEKGRAYYQEGDIILVHEEEKRYAERKFPELKEPDDDSFSMFSLIMLLLGEHEEEKFKLGWRILRVSNVGWGGGCIIVEGVIFFDNVPTALKGRAQFSVNDLNDAFIYTRTAEQLEATVVPMIKFTFELTEVLISGGAGEIEKLVGKRLLKESARIAMRKGFKKALNALLRGLAVGMVKGVISFIKGFGKEYLKDLHAGEKQHSLQLRVGAHGTPKELDLHPIIQKAILAGADAAAATLISECIEKRLMSMMDKSLKAFFPSVQKTFSDRVKIYFAKEFVKVCTTELMTKLIDAVISARKASLDAHGNVDPEKFSRKLEEKLKDALLDVFTKRAKKWGESLSEEEFEDMFH